MSLEELFKLLPEIIIYLASGYVFINVFCFFGIRHIKSEDIQGKFFISLIIGFVLKNLLAMIPIRCATYLNYLALLFVSLITAFLLAKIVRLDKVNLLLKKMSNGHTINRYFWQDIVEDEMFVRLINYEHDIMIMGYCHGKEDFERFPQLILEQYIIQDLQGKELENNCNKIREFIVVNLEKFDSVQITYNEKSAHYSKIKVEV